MDYFVYILRCADRSLYVGHAEDVDARVAKHNRGEGASFTKRRLPASVVFSERHPSRSTASSRERQLKRWTRAKKEALIAGDLVLLKRLRFATRPTGLRQITLLGVKPPKVTPNPTLPFTREEMKRILAACDKYPNRNSFGHNNRDRIRAFVLTLRYSGLRVRDCATLQTGRLSNAKLFLYQATTGTPVNIPLPPRVVKALKGIARGPYFFWTGNGLPKTAVADWQPTLRKLFELAEVKNGHAHRLRDTFAVHVQGVPVHVLVDRMPHDRWQQLGLIEVRDSHAPDLVFRVPSARESVFRGAVRADGFLVSDVIQIWLDVSSHPPRGEEQAELIYRQVIGPMINSAKVAADHNV